jgi:flagellar FliL protein
MSEHETPTAETAAKSPKSGMMGKLVVLAFLVAVIGGECLVACFYLPSVAASATMDDASPPEHAHEHKSDDKHEPHDKPAKSAATREVDLGKFSVTAFQPASNTTLLIDFHLFGTVAVEPGEEHAAASGHGGGDHGGHGGHGHEAPAADDEFSRLFKKNEHRFRDQVITIVRSAELTDYADPSLGLIRRKILEKSNRTLGKPLLREVIFSDFSLIEQ